ncbi:hypothetical protein V5O48_017909 [Marasmius crinis-equi]|uniref:Uncharacterized protein n=1 Tax=Marasmius crinis-equi TaxID=585013 RepID=A0ABR3EMN8_9AGAR
MSTVSTSSIPLPNELTEQIMSLLWLSPLTIPERVQFIQSSIQMSGLWHAIFIRVASKDFYIIGPHHAFLFVAMLYGVLKAPANSLLNLSGLCRSITIQHANDRLLPDQLDLQSIGRAFRRILQALSDDCCFVQLPLLRRISLELKNHDMGQVFQSSEHLFIHFPERVTELEFEFTYGEDMEPTQIQSIKRRDYEQYGLMRAKAAGLKKVTVLGGSIGGTTELLRVFGGPKQIQFTQDAWKESEKPAVCNDENFFEDETPLEPYYMRVSSLVTVTHPDLGPFSNSEVLSTPHAVETRDGHWLI